MGESGEPASLIVAVQVISVLIARLPASQASDVAVASIAPTVVEPTLALWAESPEKLALMVSSPPSEGVNVRVQDALVAPVAASVQLPELEKLPL